MGTSRWLDETAVAEAGGGQKQFLHVGVLQVIDAGGELLRRGDLQKLVTVENFCAKLATLG